MHHRCENYISFRHQNSPSPSTQFNPSESPLYAPNHITMALNPRFAGQKLTAAANPKTLHTLELCMFATLDGQTRDANIATQILTMSAR